MSQTVLQPELVNKDTTAGRWMVTIFNNDHNTFDEVIWALMNATGCDVEEAAIEAWEAHHFGKASVHFSSEPECVDVAAKIEPIGVKTEVTPEWRA